VLQTALDLGAPPKFDGVACVDCGRWYHLEWDHVDPLANDGVTSQANLKARCPPCHVEKTERDRRAGLLRPRAKPRAP
jgi:5-methylcytosine-specific restriction endonuclease McrA